MFVFLRAVILVLVFLIVFFHPVQLLVLSQPPELYPWQEINKLTSSSSLTGEQQVEIEHVSTSPTDNSPQESLQPGETPSLPQQAIAAEEPSPVVYSQIVKRVDVDGKVGISFDDGPYPGMTEKYLDILNDYDTRATFFMVGHRVSLYPELACKVIEQSSEIGSHSWRHDQLDQLDFQQVFADLRSVVEKVYDIAGQEVNLLRPPYGRYSEVVVAAARELNQQVVLWDVDPRDWEDPSPAEIVNTIMEQVKPGSIIVMHEGHSNTLQALPEIIQKLRERDMEPVSISELLN